MPENTNIANSNSLLPPEQFEQTSQITIDSLSSSSESDNASQMKVEDITIQVDPQHDNEFSGSMNQDVSIVTEDTPSALSVPQIDKPAPLQNTVESIGITNNFTTSLENNDTMFSWGNYFGSIAMLMLVLFALFAVLWFVKKYNKSSFFSKHIKPLTKSNFKIENVYSLGNKRSLYVVQFLHKRLLLGVTDQNINLLLELDTKDENTNKFEELLKQEQIE